MAFLIITNSFSMNLIQFEWMILADT